MDTERLRKVLELEARKGYDDKAVIRGLDAFLENFLKDMTGIAGNPALMAKLEVVLPETAYAAMDRKHRQEWAGRALQLLQELETLGAGAASPRTQPFLTSGLRWRPPISREKPFSRPALLPRTPSSLA